MLILRLTIILLFLSCAAATESHLQRAKEYKGTEDEFYNRQQTWKGNHSHALTLRKANIPKMSSMTKRKSPAKITSRVYFDIVIEEGSYEESGGRVIIGLYGEYSPKIVKRFLELCDVESELSYKGSTFHRIIPNFILQGGLLSQEKNKRPTETSTLNRRNYLRRTTKKTKPKHIYDDYSIQKNTSIQPLLKHQRLYYLSSISHTFESEFFINTVKAQWLTQSAVSFEEDEGADDKNRIFGKVLEGMEVLKQIENQGTNSGIPRRVVRIANLGVMKKPIIVN